MGAVLPKAARAKLAKILASADSDACRFVKQSGLTWQQILNPPPIEKKLPELGTWRGTCATLLEQPGLLRAWERTFLNDLPQFRRLSTKQRYCLKTIVDRVRGAGE